ncbi:MAG TPA: glucosamine kinase [Mycobacterium sp.]|nr:glucosamine kinase [Mycobacterium sp.]
MGDPLDSLDLADGKRLAIVEDDDGLAAVPMVCDPSGRWRRAVAGDGVAEALLRLLAERPGESVSGSFTAQSWADRIALGERSVGVDQTNESVIVGDTAVVKWAAHLQDGPHPAPHRIAVLRAAGFAGMPAPWGLVTWRPPNGEETLAVSVDEYLPGAVDGWTWAVDAVTEAVCGDHPDPAIDTAHEVGTLVAELHGALAGTVTVASREDAGRWRDAARRVLDVVCALPDSPSVATARERGDEIASVLDRLGTLAGTAVLDGHGDLHVGQVLRSGGRFVVTDFDGNPVLESHERMRPIPAALDVAGMTQSLAHAAIVAAKYTDLDPDVLREVDTSMRRTFLTTYRTRITELGHAGLFDDAALYPFRVQQALREIVYAARHLTRWMYVPDAALPALLDEGDHL